MLSTLGCNITFLIALGEESTEDEEIAESRYQASQNDPRNDTLEASFDEFADPFEISQEQVAMGEPAWSYRCLKQAEFLTSKGRNDLEWYHVIKDEEMPQV
jgi:hypothetical protein